MVKFKICKVFIVFKVYVNEYFYEGKLIYFFFFKVFY